MKRKSRNLGALIVGAALLLGAEASAQQVRWRASGSFTATHSTSIAMETFKSEVARLTKNTVQIDVFPGNTLGGGFEQVDQLRTNQIQMAWAGLSFYDKLLPELGAVNLPFAATSANQAICQIESDLGRFMEQRCITGPNFTARSSELFAAWVKWAASEGAESGSNKAFTEQLHNRGFDSRHSRVGNIWHGIGLTSEDP